MNIYHAKILMYHQIRQLDRDGYCVLKISEMLEVNRRTVKKYLAMSEQEYEAFLISQSNRKKELLPYERFVFERLHLYGDTSAAQMHDWLKEHHADFPKVNPKTVFNFVHWVRSKYNLPVIQASRQYEVVEELPYGKQAQVDFGEYIMRSSAHKNVRVFFFVMMLSRSRQKFIWFSNRYFTSEMAILAHEMAFEYFQGVPEEIVYDQDKVFIVSENKGDIILTQSFRAYVREKSFKLHFCRKSDPESKGKVENVVKYVKINFLYNRTYYNLDTVNDEVLAWMGRTANASVHGSIKKEPYSEWITEKPFLTPHKPYAVKIPALTYTVKKDNTISWKGNLYSLPVGTYLGRGTLVAIRQEQDALIIFDQQGTHELCRHEVAVGKGGKVINTDHKRDKSILIEEMMLKVANRFENITAAKDWLCLIRVSKSRYIRDQLLLICQAIENKPAELVNKAMVFCHQNNILSAVDFKAIVDQELKQSQAKRPEKIILLNPLSGIQNKNLKEPDKSSIQDYQELLKK
jgi:hypothetical protein